MKRWVVTTKDQGFDGLKFEDAAEVPKLGDLDVLVKLHGASLNYRDLLIPKGKYPFPDRMPVVPGSDGAGEVVEVGSKVTKWKKGDKVVTIFNQGHQFGGVDIAATYTGTGGMVDGTLRQYGAWSENGLVRAPSNLDWLEASSLTCAGVTSWNALYGLRPIKPGQSVLVQGTGGVSLFALQFAKAAGATVIATTSSAEKMELLKKLGADHVINYREDANWGQTARDLTRDKAGVDYIIEVGGPNTMGQSLKAIKFEGIISVIGFIGGMKAEKQPTTLEALSSICVIRGVYVGSRELMQDMVAAIEANDIHPHLDQKVFKLEETLDAYKYMWDQKHVGKIAIQIE